MSILDVLKKYNPDIDQISETPIFSGPNIIGWHSFALDKSGFVFAGGTADNALLARRKCLAEAFERSAVQRIYGDIFLRSEFGLDSGASSEGFAAGFERSPTAFRSICEGVEFAVRRNLAKNRFDFEEQNPQLTPLAEHLLCHVGPQTAYRLQIQNVVSKLKLPALEFFIVTAKTKLGIIAGYRVDRSDGNPWEHCAIELFRNFQNLSQFREGHLKLPHDSYLDDLLLIDSLGADYFRGRPGQIRPSLVMTLHRELDVNGMFYLARTCF